MNNKGQSLIIFVLLLPVFSLLLLVFIDIGNMQLIKQDYQNQIISTIKYGLKHISDDNIESKLNHLLTLNIDAKKQIVINNNTIRINLKSNKLFIHNILKSAKYDIDITYYGYMENGKIIILEE